MPYLSEIMENTSCKLYSNTNKNIGSCPLWMVNYLSNSSRDGHYDVPEKVDGDFLNFGYWMLTSDYYDVEDESYSQTRDKACAVESTGVYVTISPASSFYGVRPVITIPKTDIIQLT